LRDREQARELALPRGPRARLPRRPPAAPAARLRRRARARAPDARAVEVAGARLLPADPEGARERARRRDGRGGAGDALPARRLARDRRQPARVPRVLLLGAAARV